MTAVTDSSAAVRTPALAGQTVVVLGGSSGIGLATARSARAEGAELVLTGRDPERLRRAADDVGARQHAAFDAHDPERLDTFFGSLPGPVDHIMVTAGNPYYAPLPEMDVADACRYVGDHVRLSLEAARHAARAVRPGGTLLLLSGTGARRPAVGISVTALLTAGLPALTANLALEVAPVRVNLIAPGFVDTPSRPPCSARTSTNAARSYAPGCRSAASSSPRTSPRSPCTSWSTRRSPARRSTSTAASR
jgi:NAD(P)-dependent dehydrogenase (short-subunit alcohol dehydrogenase family)